jgi:hypothetical protein
MGGKPKKDNDQKMITTKETYSTNEERHKQTPVVAS